MLLCRYTLTIVVQEVGTLYHYIIILYVHYNNPNDRSGVLYYNNIMFSED